MQPEGRVSEDGELDSSVDGYDFSPMRIPGKNGFLSVIVGLYVWGSVVERGDEGEERSVWLESVRDATSVLRAMTLSEPASSSSPAPDVPPAKR